jgi:hypothetical protein
VALDHDGQIVFLVTNHCVSSTLREGTINSLPVFPHDTSDVLASLNLHVLPWLDGFSDYSIVDLWCLIQTLPGLYPYAPLNLLLVDSRLPVWLPEITISNLRVGAAVIDVRLHRTKTGDDDFEVRDKRRPLHRQAAEPLVAHRNIRRTATRRAASLLPGK